MGSLLAFLHNIPLLYIFSVLCDKYIIVVVVWSCCSEGQLASLHNKDFLCELC